MYKTILLGLLLFPVAALWGQVPDPLIAIYADSINKIDTYGFPQFLNEPCPDYPLRKSVFDRVTNCSSLAKIINAPSYWFENLCKDEDSLRYTNRDLAQQKYDALHCPATDIYAEFPNTIIVQKDTVFDLEKLTITDDYIYAGKYLNIVTVPPGKQILYFYHRYHELFDGVSMHFYDGTEMPASRVIYKDGQKNGECLFWDSSGVLVRRELWTNDTLIKTSRPKDGYVPNAETAVRIAEAVWRQIYGNQIENEKPFRAHLKGGSVWVVEGTISPDRPGGVVYARIQRADVKIIMVTHGK